MMMTTVPMYVKTEPGLKSSQQIHYNYSHHLHTHYTNVVLVLLLFPSCKSMMSYVISEDEWITT